MSINLKSGDIVYYAANRALGVLLKKTDNGWSYALRSPLREDPATVRVTTCFHLEEDFVNSIKSGRLQYYENR